MATSVSRFGSLVIAHRGARFAVFRVGSTPPFHLAPGPDESCLSQAGVKGFLERSTSFWRSQPWGSHNESEEPAEDVGAISAWVRSGECDGKGQSAWGHLH